MDLKKVLNRPDLPHKPGVYLYQDKAGRVIYVGKAVDLFHRVNSYFSGRPHDLKTTQLVQNISQIETIVVESELEALILEANLIKKFRPLYNLRLTDDKDYLYIVITEEEYPRILTARKKDLKVVKKWFGPYPSAKTVKETLKKLRRIFPWCSNPPRLQSRIGYTKPILDWKFKPCFYFHIRQCPGACVGQINKEDYYKIINRFSRFLEGKKEELIDEISKEMQRLSNDQNYEEAARIKKIVDGINYITQPTGITQYLENPNFLEDITKQGLVDLQKDLNLIEFPDRIEAYDISNFQGKEATGSMVVLTNGEIDKSQYRRFKIKISGKPNDVGMLREMIRRRLKNGWPLPQLILIDGGRGQVRAAYSELQLKNYNIPLFGLAKRMEWLYPPEGEVIKLSKRSLSLRLLQKIRDESHRFAINYHWKLRQKALGI